MTLARTPSFAMNRQDTSGVTDGIVAKRAFATFIAILLAALHATLAITAAIDKSPTFDEPTHLTAGYSYWLKNDYRLDPENGNWPARWAALPLVLSRPTFPENAAWRQADVGQVSERFLYHSGNNSDRVVLLGRSMMAVVGAGLCLLIFFCSNRLFGAIGGLISELLAVFDPNLLAHSALVTADVTAAFFFTAATWSFFQLLQSLNKRWFVITALSWSGLFLAKMSAPAFFLVAVILATLAVLSREPMTIRFTRFDRQVAARWRKLVLAIGLAGALVAIVVAAIWASYAFRFSPFAQSEPARQVWNVRWQACLSDHTTLENMVSFARDHHLLPEAYLYGFAFTNKSAMYRPAFLDGEWSNTGFASFFPRAFLYKTPIPLLLLLITAGIAGSLRWRNAWKNSGGGGAIGRDLQRLSPIWALILVYGIFSLTSHLNIGHRHLMPIYPAIFIAGGACTYFFRAQSGRAVAIFAVAMMCWQIIESSLLRPDYLTYFNQVAGGPKNGYKHLVDSSVDWGQDLPALKSWLDHRLDTSATTRLYLAYFGTALPRWYGIEATPLPLDSSAQKLTPLEPGTYCISATTLAQVYSFEHGKWTDQYESAYRIALARAAHHGLVANDSVSNAGSLQRLQFARLCAYLRKREPIANIGNSILVFQLNQRELDQALYGPPAELAPSL